MLLVPGYVLRKKMKTKKGLVQHHFSYVYGKAIRGWKNILGLLNWRDKRSGAGFTLVELMIVIAVIGVMAAALGGWGRYENSRKRARDAKKMSELEQARADLEMCRADTGTYSGCAYSCPECTVQNIGATTYQLCVHVDCMINGSDCSGAGEDYCQNNP